MRLSADLAAARTRATGMTDMMDLYGIGDHGGGPTRAVLDQGYHWATPSIPAKVVPNMQFGTAQTWFSRSRSRLCRRARCGITLPSRRGMGAAGSGDRGQMAIPTWKSELYFEYHRGVMTTQAKHKRNMRESEVEVLDAEKWSSLAWLDGWKYPGRS